MNNANVLMAITALASDVDADDLRTAVQLGFPNSGTEQGNGNRTITAYFSIQEKVKFEMPEKAFGGEKEKSSNNYGVHSDINS